MKPPATLDVMTPVQLKELVIGLLGEGPYPGNGRRTTREIARQKGLKGPPSIKRSGMDNTNGSENDIRYQVTRRKVGARTRSEGIFGSAGPTVEDEDEQRALSG